MLCAGVTFIGFGALEIGRDWGMGDPTRPEEDQAIAVVQGVLCARQLPPGALPHFLRLCLSASLCVC